MRHIISAVVILLIGAIDYSSAVKAEPISYVDLLSRKGRRWRKQPRCLWQRSRSIRRAVAARWPGAASGDRHAAWRLLAGVVAWRDPDGLYRRGYARARLCGLEYGISAFGQQRGGLSRYISGHRQWHRLSAQEIDHEYNLDIKNIIVVGHSAGGHLALWAAARPHIKPTSALYRPNPLPVKLAVSLAGINDLRAYRNSGPGVCGGPGTIDRLINADARHGQDPYADTSPAAMLPLNVQQLIVSGSQDPIVPSRFGRDYGTAAKSSGDPVKIIEIEGAGHFELIDPISEAWIKIRTDMLSYAHRE